MPSDEIHSAVLSVAARQAAKRQKLEDEKNADAKNNTALSDDVSKDKLTAAEDVQPEFSYKLPPAFEGIANLPPSVLPPRAEAFVGKLSEWG